MALITGFGSGALNLTIDGGTLASFPARNISINFERSTFEITQLSDVNVKFHGGRSKRTVSFEIFSQNGSSDDAIRTTMTPATVALMLTNKCVLGYTDQGGIAYSITGILTSATRTDDGSGPATWSLTLTETVV